MDSNWNYEERLNSDLLEQFRGMPKIEALVSVIAKQMQDVYEFFVSLGIERTIDTAYGKQLDGIGSILALTRVEAWDLADSLGMEINRTDEDYRGLLKYKIFINSAKCTYEDVVKSIDIVGNWKYEYSESPDRPATILINFERFVKGADSNERLVIVPVVKPAGVQVKYRGVINAKSSVYDGVTMIQKRSYSFSIGEV